MGVHLDERLAAVVRALPEVVAAYLFGSRAGERARQGSDVDVAVIFAPGVDRESRFRLRCLLSERLARTVRVASADVVDLEAASPLLAHEVLRRGRLLLSRDQARRLEVVTRQIMRYIDSRPMRRELDEATFRRLREGNLGRVA
jgi:predicted nucleotidyltransferase